MGVTNPNHLQVHGSPILQVTWLEHNKIPFKNWVGKFIPFFKKKNFKQPVGWSSSKVTSEN